MATRAWAEYENRRNAEPISTEIVAYNGVVESAWCDWGAKLTGVTNTRPGRSATCRTRTHSRPELSDALHEAGFAVVSFAGDFAGGPVRPENRTVVTAITRSANP
ncbi:hypothetical protein [Kitasatospora sp. NPDC127116]|uniref:hypothetical protein n=1 Tax=Kitasatospora sp. NPDC127116 TaxID=3345367 RepID=UPI00364308BE